MIKNGQHDRAHGSPPSLAYIAGYGRSGSTVFEKILASHPAVWASGELNFFPHIVQRADEARCSCGENILACPRWSLIVKTYLSSTSEESRRRVAGRVGPEALPIPIARHFLSNRRHSNICAHYSTLYGLLNDHMPPGVRVLVESSKTAYTTTSRPWFIHSLTGFDVRILHLVRDPRAVMWSLQSRGLNRRLERNEPPHRSLAAERAIIGWKWANRAAEVAGAKLGEGHYLRVRYEDFTADPLGTLKRVAPFLGIDPRPYDIWDSGTPVAVLAHQIAGNRARSATTIRIARDEAWKENLMPRLRIGSMLVARHMMQRYGYDEA